VSGTRVNTTNINLDALPQRALYEQKQRDAHHLHHNSPRRGSGRWLGSARSVAWALCHQLVDCCSPHNQHHEQAHRRVHVAACCATHATTMTRPCHLQQPACVAEISCHTEKQHTSLAWLCIADSDPGQLSRWQLQFAVPGASLGRRQSDSVASGCTENMTRGKKKHVHHISSRVRAWRQTIKHRFETACHRAQIVQPTLLY
jgi:hypothetical protein